jgi:predicted Zn finger-like uncharacterized protein
MKFVCERCQTRYSIADEKVRQKILRIRCKTCGNVIMIQGELSAGSGGDAATNDGAALKHFETAKTAASINPMSVPSSESKAVPSSVPRGGPSTAPTVAPFRPSSAPRTAPAISPTPTSVPSNVPKVAPASAARSVPAIAPKVAPVSGARSVPVSAPKVAPAGAATSVPASELKVAPHGAPTSAMPGPPPPPPPAAAVSPDPIGGRVEWYVAAGGVRSGPFSRVEAAQKIISAEAGRTVHVWKAGMPGWKPSDEVPVIARELNLLRPPPPPPPPESARVSPVQPPAPPKVAAVPAVANRPASAHEDQPIPLFPGKPIKPLPGGIFDSLEISLEADLGVFSDTTTKKAEHLRALPKEPGNTVPTEAAQPVAGAKAGSTVASASTNQPVVLPAGSPPPRPGLASPTVSAPASEVLPSPPAPAASSFSEVAQAEAASEAPSSSIRDFPSIITPSEFETLPAELLPDAGFLSGKRPGLKYLVAACAIVILVILIVLVTLRMDSRKVPDVVPLPSSTTTAATAAPAAAPEPRPVAVEPSKPETVVEDKTASGARPTGKRGSVKTLRRVDVGPAPERQPAPAKPVTKPTLGARPNPFDEARNEARNEAKAVSQSQISSVVRNKANQSGLKTCYERALKMDNHLTSGRIDVTVSIGTSGAVQRVVVNAPSTFILVEPCIKNAVRRWVFPPSGEEYATNFPLIMQGGM